MKLLVLWNCAGAFTPVIKWMKDRGHEVRVVTRNQFDEFGHTRKFDSSIMVDSPKDYYLSGIRQIRHIRPDVVHISSHMKMLTLARLFAMRTPIVLSYHGDHVRGRNGPHSEAQLADLVTVTTPDLADYGQWIDRPIDNMFYDRGGREPQTALGFYAENWLSDTRPVMETWCEERGIRLTLIDRSREDFDPIPWAKMPAFLSRFEYFLDFKGFVGEQFALSKTALEAMACGCKVVHDGNPDTFISDYKLVHPQEYFELYSTLERASVWKAAKRLPRVFLALLKWGIGRLD